MCSLRRSTSGMAGPSLMMLLPKGNMELQGPKDAGNRMDEGQGVVGTRDDWDSDMLDTSTSCSLFLTLVKMGTSKEAIPFPS